MRGRSGSAAVPGLPLKDCGVCFGVMHGVSGGLFFRGLSQGSRAERWVCPGKGLVLVRVCVPCCSFPPLPHLLLFDCRSEVAPELNLLSQNTEGAQ